MSDLGSEHAQAQAISIPSEAREGQQPDDSEVLELVRSFEKYDFGGDQEFRKGLPAIIKGVKGKKTTAAQIDEVIARAQWFYFTRQRHSNVAFDTYLLYRTSDTESLPMKSASTTGSSIKSPGPRPQPKLADGGISVTSAELEDMRISGHMPPPSDSCPSYEPPSGAMPSVDSKKAPESGSLSAPAQPDANLAASASAGTRSEPPAYASPTHTPVPAGGSQPATIETVAPLAGAAAGTNLPFGQLVELIASGRADEVPMQEIPEGLNMGEPSVAALPQRRKPWELGSAAGSAPAGSGAGSAASAA